MPGENRSRDPHQIVSRQHVIDVLTRAGMTASEAEGAISGISLPAEVGSLLNHLGSQGLTHDGLISRLGGSP
jgi:hypothetical protein